MLTNHKLMHSPQQFTDIKMDAAGKTERNSQGPILVTYCAQKRDLKVWHDVIKWALF